MTWQRPEHPGVPDNVSLLHPSLNNPTSFPFLSLLFSNMGISFSSGRRNHHYYHHHYHHPPPPPPPYFYPSSSGDPSFLLPSPPPQSNTPTCYQYQHYAQPPPQPNYYFPPWNYNSLNYPNNYGIPGHGWPPMGAPVTEEPPLFVERQNSKVVKNDVNVHKDSIQLEIDERNPNHYLVSFVFDAHFDGGITIYYFAKEEDESCKFSSEFSVVYKPVQISFTKGLGQRFRQPSGTGVDFGFFELEALGKPSEDDVFPLVIFAEVFSLSQETSSRVQVTQAVIEKKSDISLQVKVIGQILWINGVRYEIHELFGIGNSSEERFNDDEPGTACVICMTEPKNTAVMPCRHLCMCSDCAKELRLQSSNCPICRQPITELIEININNDNH